ncbi:hypothetical protein DCC81_01175 [Chitinophaga parva]|uniref:Glycosyl transferase family 1 domain-containing protein n=1 Tax=Chitinophaga parva TaxID=2169414 RepID=A0A2T7BKB8_9BACT|nr:glycosyltransferase family 4 protein [Chitinophaga parva]PUZ28124.1 hypothetical protein DCC81_01175 [Chitinophaga parva]
MSKKILICNDFELLPRKGGPSTYLWNLRQYIIENQISNIDFLDNFQEAKALQVASGSSRFDKGFWKSGFGRNLRAIISFFYSIKRERIDAEPVMSNYDVLHFHSSRTLYRYRHVLKQLGSRPVIILQSHSPSAWHCEMLEEWFKLSPDSAYGITRALLQIPDKYAFSRADYLIFPCEGAMEPYKHSWRQFDTVIKDKKVLFLPTGTKQAHASKQVADVRALYHIPLDAKVICFAGRHNKIKGYDVLKATAIAVLAANPNIYFLNAGTPSPLQPLEHPNWIEVGWTNDPHSVINAADYFVLPNRETYFDLILLEALSLGKKAVISNTGGNKYFKQFSSPDIHYFESEDVTSLADLLLSVCAVDKGEPTSTPNLDIFQQHFTADVFGQKYLELVNSLNA